MIFGLQIAGVLLNLAFGLLALLAWRRMAGRRWERTPAAWLIAGATFAFVGISGSAFLVLGYRALGMDPHSAAFAASLRWLQAGNVGRDFAIAAFAVVLGVYLTMPAARAARVARMSAGLVPAVGAGVTVLTGLGPGAAIHEHLTALAVFAALTVLALMVVLLAGVRTDGLDQLLWLAVAAYTVKDALCANLLTLVAWWEVVPQPVAMLAMYWINATGMAVMVALAARRVHHATAHHPVPALFERLHSMRGRSVARG
jgi:hypothetical protein